MATKGAVGIHFCFDDVEVDGKEYYVEGYARADIVNHGIGAYEFWGKKGFDSHYGPDTEFQLSVDCIDRWNDETNNHDKVLDNDEREKVIARLYSHYDDRIQHLLEEASHEEPYHPDA